MKIQFGKSKASFWKKAFSIVEVMVGMAIVGVLFISLYAGFASGFQVIHVSRENLRATQILLEKMETIRLYTWEQINSNGFVPSSFTASYYPGSSNNVGLVYYGSVAIANSPNDTSYYTNMKSVTVTVRWTNANIARSRAMSTFVSKYGLQNYIY
jgi:prepilin-type N-terminal cleavage/methylation domain-containing protein